ncbi:MAG: M48 family metallopeptidase [Steroidobacterales bacterium]
MLRQLELWDHKDEAREWAVRPSVRARRLSVRVFRDGGVEIVVPPRTSPQRVSAFVAQHREWIERQRRRSGPREESPFPPASLQLAAIGESWSCTAVPDSGRVRVIEEFPGRLRLLGPLHHAETLRQRLRDWLLQHAGVRLEPPLRQLSAEMGVCVQRLQLRYQRTRWGSCSRRGTISLNVCVLFQRPEVLRYLLVHELSHLRHMNHSQRFWDHVGRFEPEWQRLDVELLQGWRLVPSWLFNRVRPQWATPAAAAAMAPAP